MILLTSHILSNFLMINLRKPQHLCNLDYTVSSYYYPLLPPPIFFNLHPWFLSIDLEKLILRKAMGEKLNDVLCKQSK